MAVSRFGWTRMALCIDGGVGMLVGFRPAWVVGVGADACRCLATPDHRPLHGCSPPWGARVLTTLGCMALWHGTGKLANQASLHSVGPITVALMRLACGLCCLALLLATRLPCTPATLGNADMPDRKLLGLGFRV